MLVVVKAVFPPWRAKRVKSVLRGLLGKKPLLKPDTFGEVFKGLKRDFVGRFFGLFRVNNQLFVLLRYIIYYIQLCEVILCLLRN